MKESTSTYMEGHMRKLTNATSALTVLGMIGLAVYCSTSMASETAMSSKTAMPANDCAAVSGVVLSNLNKMIEGYNKKDDSPFRQYLDDKVVMAVFEVGGRVRQANGKQEYLDDLHKAWKTLDPQWENACFIEQSSNIANVVKILATYDFTLTPPSKPRRKVPSMAVFYFSQDGKLMDATYSTR
jgi:hypothetical protein